MESWHRGKVMMQNSDQEIEGEILYNIPKNTILLKSTEGKTLSLTAVRVGEFVITDANSGKRREFYSIPYQTDKSYKRPVFFEVLYEDNFALLCREEIIEDQIPVTISYGIWMSGAQSGYRYIRQEVFQFFMLTNSNEIIALDSDPKKLPEQFPDRRSEMADFIQNQAINPKKVEDMIKLMSFYNDLKR